jgi:hypothetical protein
LQTQVFRARDCEIDDQKAARVSRRDGARVRQIRRGEEPPRRLGSLISVTVGLVFGDRCTLTKPAASKIANARPLAAEPTPAGVRYLFVSGKVFRFVITASA